MLDAIEEIRGMANEVSRQSSLSGEWEGPRDALRHLIGVAELRRRFGPIAARGIAEGNELLGILKEYPASSFHMDRWNNAIGLDIGSRARTFEEVVMMSRAAVERGIENGGSGEDNTPRWRPQNEWDGPNGPELSPDGTPAEMRDLGPNMQLYRFGGPEQRWGAMMLPSEYQKQYFEALEQTPPELWTSQDARAVIGSRAYQNRAHPDHQAWQDRVREHFAAVVERERAAEEAEREEEEMAE